MHTVIHWAKNIGGFVRPSVIWARGFSQPAYRVSAEGAAFVPTAFVPNNFVPLWQRRIAVRNRRCA